MRKNHVLVIALLLGALVSPALAGVPEREPSAPIAAETLLVEATAPAPPEATPGEALERARDAVLDMRAGKWALGIGGLLWAVFTLLRLPQLGAQLERVPAAWRPLLVLGSGLLAAGAFALGGAVPAGLLEALGLGAGGAGLAMGAHDALTPARRALRARRQGTA